MESGVRRHDGSARHSRVAAEGSTTPVLPNFLVIGAGKSGTTSLHRWLGQHPDVFVPRIKETNYFTFEAVRVTEGEESIPEGSTRFPIRSWDAYLDLYRDAGSHPARGEVSPSYLNGRSVPERIAARLPDVRLIAVLRHPVDRAYSSFLMHTRDGREHRSFSVAIEEELAGTADPSLNFGQLHYLELGFYDDHLAAYRAVFDSSQIHIELFEDLRSDAAGVMRRIYRLLEVDEGFEPDTTLRMNPSGVPRRRLLAPILRKNRVGRLVKAALPDPLKDRAERAYDRWRARHLVKPPLEAGVRAELVERYREDIHRLSLSIGRDLGHWLE